jgi:outer membrane protein, heavy metal efflux system
MQNAECGMRDKAECGMWNEECQMTNKSILNAAFCILHAIVVLGGLLTPALRAQTPATLPMPAPQTPAATPTAAREGEPLTLTRLEQLAEQYHPILPRDRAQIDAALGHATQAGMWRNPRFSDANPQTFAGRNTLQYVGISQEIPVMGKKRLEGAAANEIAHQQEFNYGQDRYQLFTNIRQQFYQLLADQRRIQVLAEMVNVVRRSYEMGEQKRKAGVASPADLLLLRLDVQRAEASLLSARALLEGDRKQMGAIVGVPGLVDHDVNGELSGDYPVFDEEGIKRYVTAQNTHIRIAQAVVAQYQLQLRRAEVEPYPNPFLGPAYQYGLVPGAEQFWLNIQFDIPVWNRNQGGIREARGQLLAAQKNLATIQYDLLNRAHDLYGQFQAARAVVRKFETEILPNARELLRLAREGYGKGLTDFATFLQVQRGVVQANLDYVTALTDLWMNAVQLAGLLQLEKFR